MNKHIELVKKWLADRKSVTKEELEANADAANAADAAYAASNAAAGYAAYASNYAAAANTAFADAAYHTSKTKYWVDKAEELANEH